MAYVPAPGVVQVELTAMMAGQRTQNVLHYKLEDGVYDITEMEALGNAIVDYISQSFVKGLWPSTWALQEVRVVDLTFQNGMVVNVTNGLPIVGTRSGAQLPNNCALVLTKRTLQRGRSYRGRIYFGPLVESDVTDNTVLSTTVSSILINLSGLIKVTDVDSNVHEMVVLSRFANGVERSEAVATEVVGFTSDGVVDSQRRRLPGRGN